MDRNRRNVFLKKTEWIAIIVVMHYCIIRFLESTTFNFEFNKVYMTVTLASLALIGTPRLLIGLWGEYKDKGLTKGLAAKILMIAAAGISSLIVELKFDYTFFIFLVFSAFCLYGIDCNKVLKAFVVTIGTMLAATVLCCLGGVIENYHYLTPGVSRNRLLRSSYGTCYPTDFASYLVFLIMFFWCSGKRKPIVPVLTLTISSLLFIYNYTNSNTSEICLILLAILVIYEAVENRFMKHHKKLEGFTDNAAVWVFPILGVVFCVLIWLYGQGNALAKQVNTTLTSRLSIPWELFQQKGIQAFGIATLQHGNGGGDIHKWTGSYDFLDSTFGLFLIRYGWMITLIVTIVWVWMTRKAIKNGNRALAFGMVVIAAHAFSEHHFPEINYNILLAMPFCNFSGRKKTGEQEEQKKTWIPWVVGTAVLVICALLSPTILSYLRTVFDLTGKNRLFALLLSVFLVALIGGTIYYISKTIQIAANREKSRKRVIGLAVSFCLLMGMFVGSNIYIGTGMDSSRLTADERAINTILSAATEPVYADSFEELYKRKYPGISGHIWSLQEMARLQHGTIITDREPEANKLISMGAVYAEISDDSSIYTFDDAVEEALRKEGFTCRGYYYTKRTLNNTVLADMNHLKQDKSGSVLLKEGDSVTKGPYLTLYRGPYRIEVEIAVDPGNLSADESVCTLMITSNEGENLLFQKELTQKDLNENGILEGICDCNIRKSANVRFEVNAYVPLQVKSISWMRNETADTRKKYDALGRITEEFYYSLDHEPLIQAQGYAGIKYKYESGHDNWINMQYIDANRNPVLTGYGYAQSNRIIQDSQIMEQWYYDDHSDLIRLAKGYAGVKHTYDSNGRIQSESYFDEDKKVVNCINGYASVIYNYDNDGNIINQKFMDETGWPVVTASGYAEVRREYDNKKIIREFYYGEDGKPLIQSAGYAAIVQEWDGDVLTARTYLDPDGNPMLRNDGYVKAVWKQDKKGIWNLHFEDLLGQEVSLDNKNLARDIHFGPDGWSEWMVPAPNVTNTGFNIGSVNLGSKSEGDVFTTAIEIEFKDVLATPGRQIRFLTQGAQDNRWFTGNIWNENLISLYDEPENGVYRFTSIVEITGEMADVSIFDIGFRCDNWKKGMFRVKNIKIEKGDTSTKWDAGL